MKILVTVGTTCFDSMVEAVDKCAATLTQHQFTFQIADGSYKPLHGEYFDFVGSINDYYNSSDIIITHAGAGTTYKLLELHKKIVVVPNLERVDKHQSDIARFLDENKYALLVWNLGELPDILCTLDTFNPAPYRKDPFFKAEEIAALITA